MTYDEMTLDGLLAEAATLDSVIEARAKERGVSYGALLDSILTSWACRNLTAAGVDMDKDPLGHPDVPGSEEVVTRLDAVQSNIATVCAMFERGEENRGRRG